MRLGLLLVELLLVLLYFLLLLLLHLHGGVGGNHKNFSLMCLVSDFTLNLVRLSLLHQFPLIYTSLQLRRILKSILGSLKGFHCENYKLQLIALATKTFWDAADLVKSTKVALQMVHWLL